MPMGLEPRVRVFIAFSSSPKTCSSSLCAVWAECTRTCLQLPSGLSCLSILLFYLCLFNKMLDVFFFNHRWQLSGPASHRSSLSADSPDLQRYWILLYNWSWSGTINHGLAFEVYAEVFCSSNGKENSSRHSQQSIVQWIHWARYQIFLGNMYAKVISRQYVLFAMN